MAMKIKTPVGKLFWVRISGDGYDASIIGGEKSGDTKMVKSACLHLNKNSKECKDFIKLLETEWEDYKSTKKIKTPAKSMGFKPVLDENGKETEFIEFKFKTNSFFPDGKPNVVKVLNAKGNEIDLGDRLIGNESVGVIHGTVAPYTFAGSHGLSLYLVAIQLVKFVEYSGGIEADDLSDLSEGDDEPAFEGFNTSDKPDI